MTFFSNKAEKEEPALSSVNLIIDKEEYPVYRGNEWFNALNRDCGEFIEQGNLREEGLNQCLRGPRGSAFHLYLKSLKMATVVLGEKELKRHAEIIEMMEASEPLELEAESTAFENDNVMILSSYGDYPNYADYYCKVYGFPIPTLPESLRNIDKMVGLDLYNVTTTLPADTDPVLYRLVSKDGISYIPLDPNSIDISIEMKRVPGALGLARGFERETKKAAQALHVYHPDIPPHLFKIVLYKKVIGQGATLRFEDPWQDIGACSYAHCEHEQAFKKVFEGVPYGIKEAAQSSLTRGHFEELLSQADIKGDQALLRTLFDKPTYAYAMVLDYVLQKLKSSVLTNPKLGYSPVLPPFINDHEVARQLSLVFTATLLAAQPERDELARLIALGSPYDLIRIYFTCELMGMDNPFPAIPVRRLSLTVNTDEVFMTYLPQAR